MRSSVFALLLAFLVADDSVAALFTPFISNKLRTLLKATQHKTSWSEYKHDFIDPLVVDQDQPQQEEERHHEALLLDPSSQRRQSADQFWEAWTEEERQKLHGLNELATARAAAASTIQFAQGITGPNKRATFDEYQHKHLDRMVLSSVSSSSVAKDEAQKEGGERQEKRKVADEFWLQMYMDEKARLRSRKDDEPKQQMP